MSVRAYAKITPRNSRINIPPSIRGWRKYAFVKAKDKGSWDCIEKDISYDDEQEFEENEIDYAMVFLVPPECTEQRGHMYYSLSTTAGPQNLLVEGGCKLDMQREVYMERAANACGFMSSSMKKLCLVTLVLLGQFHHAHAAEFLVNPEGPSFNGDIPQIRGHAADKQFEKLQRKIVKERPNVILVLSRHADQKDKEKFEEIILMKDSMEHFAALTPQFDFRSEAMQLQDLTRRNGPGDISMHTTTAEIFEPFVEWSSKKDKHHAPRSIDDIVRDPTVAQLMDRCHQNLLQAGVQQIAFPAEAQESAMEELGTIDVPDQDDGEPIIPDVRELEQAFDEEEQMLDEIPLPALPTDEADRRQKWLQLPRTTRNAIRRLHRQFGHCPNRVLTEILKASGASQEYIQAARLVRCQGCEHEKPKPQSAKTTLPRSQAFNTSVGVDIFEVKDSSGQRFSILSFLCLGTLYHQAAIVSTSGGQVSSGKCFEVFNDCWTRFAGLPKEIVSDRGLHNRGEFSKGLSARGVILRNIGVESPEQLGRVERHGSILKGIVTRTIHEIGAQGEKQVKQILTEALNTKNEQSRVKGFSPSQWVLGMQPKGPCSMTGEEHDLGLLQFRVDDRHEFARLMNVREAARKAFIKEDMSKRVARALLRKAAPVSKEYHVGDLVCFKTDQSGWTTACRVIGFEGPKLVWVIHQGMPACVALDRLRPVNASEALAYQHLKNAGGLGMAASRRTGFIDASAPLEPVEEEEQIENGHEQSEEEEEDEEVVEDERPMRNVRRRRQESQATEAEPEQEEIPGSRRRSRVEDELLDDVPITIRRRIGSEATESRANDSATGSNQSPLVEAMQRAGTTGAGLDLMWQVVEEAGLIIRQHNGPRTALFVPDAADKCPIDLKELSETRLTEMTFADGQRKRTHDLWNEGQSVHQDKRWTGKTVFFIKDHAKKKQATQKETSTFMTERIPRNVALAGYAGTQSKTRKLKTAGKQFDFPKESPEIQEGILGSRSVEWQKWQRFMAADPVSDELARELISEGHKPINTQWIDTDKDRHLKRPGVPHKIRFKSRMVALGNEEVTDGIRTDSPTAETDAINLILSWAASQELRIRTLDITNAYFHGEPMTRVLLLRQPRDGIPGVEPGKMLICRTPIYGTRDSGRLFWKRLSKEIKSTGLTVSKISPALFYFSEDGDPKVMVASHVDDLIYACKPGYESYIKTIQKIFQVEDAKISSGSFRFCGRES